MIQIPVKFSRRGNSMGVCIPAQVRALMRLRLGDYMLMEATEEQIVLSPQVRHGVRIQSRLRGEKWRPPGEASE